MINFSSNKHPNNIISLKDTLINNVYNYKYIGINIDSKLDFNHIISLNNKLSQIKLYVSMLSKFIKTNSLIIYLNYGNIIWGNTFSNDIISVYTMYKYSNYSNKNQNDNK